MTGHTVSHPNFLEIVAAARSTQATCLKRALRDSEVVHIHVHGLRHGWVALEVCAEGIRFLKGEQLSAVRKSNLCRFADAASGVLRGWISDLCGTLDPVVETGGSVADAFWGLRVKAEIGVVTGDELCLPAHVGNTNTVRTWQG